VVACNQAAAALGVRYDLPVGELAGLLAAAPRAEQRPHDPVLDRQALQQLAQACQTQFSPLVALEPMADRPWAGQRLWEPSALALDVTGIGALFHGEGSLLRQIVRWFAARGLRAHVAAAESFAAAWAIAHCVVGRRQRSPAAPLAAPPDRPLSRWLDPLPVAALRLPAEMLERLQRLGLDTIGLLNQLPREGLTARFGPLLLQRLDQAFGRFGEPLQMLPLPPGDSAQLRFEYPTVDRQIIAHHLQQLLAPLADDWRRRRQGALRLVCRCDCVEHQCWEWVVGLFAPSADAEHLTGLCLVELERRRAPAAVEKLTVTATLLAPLEQRQAMLLPELATTADDSLTEARLIDVLSNRLGRQRVLGVAMTRDAQPERAYQYQPLAGNPRPRSKVKAQRRSRKRAAAVSEEIPPAAERRGLARSASGPDTTSASTTLPHTALPGAAETTEPAPLFGPQPWDAGRRPLTLLEPPQAVEVLAVFPNGLPQCFAWQGNRWEVLQPNSGERIETGWWRGATIRRDYYRVTTPQGLQFWLFRDLRDQCWYMHGRFD
jgi:protein ImuB